MLERFFFFLLKCTLKSWSHKTNQLNESGSWSLRQSLPSCVFTVFLCFFRCFVREKNQKQNAAFWSLTSVSSLRATLMLLLDRKERDRRLHKEMSLTDCWKRGGRWNVNEDQELEQVNNNNNNNDNKKNYMYIATFIQEK